MARDVSSLSVEPPNASPGAQPKTGIPEQAVDVLAATGAGTDISATLVAQPQPGSYPVAEWDRYEFLSLLGRGGMGAVYKARDRQLARIVALKFIRGDEPVLLQRFIQEAHTQARLDHPNLCRIYEVGQVDAKPYIAMQFVERRTLAD